MISGRGLGHTGGTLDKLESIPGYTTRPEMAQLRRVVDAVGCAIVGQTAELAPADGRLYAIRDVTATVESRALIAASILAKKLAAGVQGLVMDVKCGSGAFLPDPTIAAELGRNIVSVAEAAGMRCVALLTDMDEVLGRHAGNALEVAEAVAMLRDGGGEPRLHELVLALAAEALMLGDLAGDRSDGRARAAAALASGAAAERFERMVHALGGPSDLVANPQRYLPQAPVIRPVPAARAGYVVALDVRALGLAIVRLGGGRTRPDAAIDHRVGLADCVGRGVRVERGDPLAFVHAADEDSAQAAIAAVRDAIQIGDALPPSAAVVRGRMVGGRCTAQ